MFEFTCFRLSLNSPECSSYRRESRGTFPTLLQKIPPPGAGGGGMKNFEYSRRIFVQSFTRFYWWSQVLQTEKISNLTQTPCLRVRAGPGDLQERDGEGPISLDLRLVTLRTACPRTHWNPSRSAHAPHLLLGARVRRKLKSELRIFITQKEELLNCKIWGRILARESVKPNYLQPWK